MIGREKLLREFQFIGSTLGGRTETLDKIGQDYAIVYKFLLDNPDIDPFKVNIEDRLIVIRYQHVWDTIDEMKYDKGLTGCEVAARLIRKYQPFLANIPVGSLAFGRPRTTQRYITE